MCMDVHTGVTGVPATHVVASAAAAASVATNLRVHAAAAGDVGDACIKAFVG